MTGALDDDDSRTLAISVAATLALTDHDRAFDATIGLRSATALASSSPATAPAVGPRTLDIRELPRIVTSAEDGKEPQDLAIKETLGEGGMGVVERAHQRSLQRDVAIKRVRDDSPPDRYGALLAEAVFTGFLEHPNIIPVHALGRDDAGRPLMVMKKVEGVTLDTLIRDPSHEAFARTGQDRLAFFIDVARRVLDALAFAHSKGVIHRDIKPANVMIGRFGEVYLLDWGIAMRMGERLAPDAIAGSPAYMAPEMLRPAAGEIDTRTDIYLLGATLHECLTGAPPHGGRTMIDVLTSVAFSSPCEYAADAPEELVVILRRAMHSDRSERFATAEQVGLALARFETHRAASDLANVASGRLDELRTMIANGASPPDVHAVFHECRFGFEQSQKGYPEGLVSRRGLRDAFTAMISFELAQRNAASAESLLARVDTPPPELIERLEILKGELVHEAHDRERLRRIEHDLDDEVGSRERAFAARGILGVLFVFAIMLISLRVMSGFMPGPRAMALAMVPGGLALAMTLVRWRARFFGNLLARQMSFTVLGLFVAIATNRVSGALVGRAFADIAANDALIVSTVASLSALTLRRAYLFPAVLFWLASISVPFSGDRAFAPLIVAAVLSVGIVIAAPEKLRPPLLNRAGEKTDDRQS